MVAEVQLKIALVTTGSHVTVAPRRRSLLIPPYGTMAAAEGTSVSSALMHDCCDLLRVFGGLIKKGGHHLESTSTSQLWALSSLQNKGILENSARSTSVVPPKYIIW